jgi:glutamate dehydrogenase (NAD(P)+)
MKLAGAQVAIAGFSAESRWLASALESARASVVAVSDKSGAVFHRSRLDVRPLLEFVEKEDVVFGYPHAESMSAEEMMQLSCDVLVLSAGQELRVSPKARVVVEAGGKVNCMLRKETLVLPSLLADAGLRIADFLEWRKSACGVVADRELLRGLQGQVRKTWSEVWEHAQHYDIGLEQSAMAIGVGRVAQAMRMR